jgi:hypothetical protein
MLSYRSIHPVLHYQDMDLSKVCCSRNWKHESSQRYDTFRKYDMRQRHQSVSTAEIILPFLAMREGWGRDIESVSS